MRESKVIGDDAFHRIEEELDGSKWRDEHRLRRRTPLDSGNPAAIIPST